MPTGAINIHDVQLHPKWGPLRADPRFAAIDERAGVPFPPPPKRAAD